MPIVNIMVTREGSTSENESVTAEQKGRLIKGVSELLLEVLNKPLDSTFVTIQEIELENWGWGGLPVPETARGVCRHHGSRQHASGCWPPNGKSDGRFGKQDFVYLPTEDVYRCPAGEKLAYRYTNEEDGKTLRRYWTTACPRCPLKSRCTTGSDRRITRWEHEHVARSGAAASR
jgi:4-oxalocrotonate tautomerase family enzyme